MAGIPKDASDAKALAERLVSHYEARDRRMDDDQDLFQMEAAEVDGEQVGLSMAEGRIACEKVAAMLAGSELVYECATDDQQSESAVQRIEDLLVEADYRFAVAWQQAGNMPLRQHEATTATLRGQVAGELLLDPSNPRWPFQYTPLDPREVYAAPALGSQPPPVIVRVQHTTAAELQAHPVWGKRALQLFDERDAAAFQKRVTLRCFYTPTELACLADDEWLKKPTPHGYGFNPLIKVDAAGAPYRYTDAAPRLRNGRRDDSGRTRVLSAEPTDYTAHVGAGLLTLLHGPLRDKEQVLIMQRTLLAAEADPGALYKTRDPDVNPDDIDLRKKMVGDQDSGMEVFYPGRAAIQDSVPILNALQDTINRVLPPMLFGEGNPATSGFDRGIAMASAKHLLLPYARALEMFYLLRARGVLALFARFGALPIPLLGQGVEGGRSAVQRIQPYEVQGADMRLRVKLREMATQERAAMANVAAQLTREGILDYDTARGDEFLNLRNPRKVGAKALEDQANKIPELVRLRSIRAMFYDQLARAQSGDPSVLPEDLQDLGLLYQQTRQQFLAAMTQPVGQQPPTAQPGMPNLGGGNELAGLEAAAPNQQALGPPASAAPGQLPTPDTIPM